MGLQRSWLPQPLPSFVFGACCRDLVCGRYHTTRKGCVDASGQHRALEQLGLGLVSIWQSWRMPAFPVVMAVGFQVSCFVAGFLCDLFFLKNRNYSSAAVNFMKPQPCVCISHQEGLQLEVHVPACSFCHRSAFLSSCPAWSCLSCISVLWL